MKDFAANLLDELKTASSLKTDQDLAEMFEVTRQCIYRWRNHGIPRAWLLYLRERYPTLKAWQLADETAASAKDLPN